MTGDSPRTSVLAGLTWALGVYPDATIAKVAGVSRQAVLMWRNKYRIPAPPTASEYVMEAMKAAQEQRTLTNGSVNATVLDGDS